MSDDKINPISYIEDEFDKLAETIAAHYSMKTKELLKNAVRYELEQWKKRKIVRFHYSQPKDSLRSGSYDLLNRFIDNHGDELQDMAGHISEDEENMAITWYMIAFKENF